MKSGSKAKQSRGKEKERQGKYTSCPSVLGVLRKSTYGHSSDLNSVGVKSITTTLVLVGET